MTLGPQANRKPPLRRTEHVLHPRRTKKRSLATKAGPRHGPSWLTDQSMRYPREQVGARGMHDIQAANIPLKIPRSEVNDGVDSQHQLVILSAIGGVGWIVKRLGAEGPLEEQFGANGDRVA
jgi:hypothetical protein